MKIAVFADVHANLEALLAFFDHSKRQKINFFFFLGDIVGYGPNPDECVDVLRRMENLNAVMGNHDSAVLWKTSPYAMNTHARDSILWTMDQLKKENIKFIQNLEQHIVYNGVCYCHSTPSNPESCTYLHSTSKALMAFLGSSYWLSFVSHTHSPLVICKKKYLNICMDKVVGGEKVQLHKDRRWIINCGSVGQPRDGIAGGSYCIYDDIHRTVVFHRFSYDYEATATKIMDTGLPEYLGRRLKTGH